MAKRKFKEKESMLLNKQGLNYMNKVKQKG
jgi:hypothetical protein